MRLGLPIQKQRASQRQVAISKCSQFTLIVLLIFYIFCTSVSAEDFDENNLRAIAASLASDLADPFDKFELATDIRSFFLWRQRLHKMGDYKSELEQHFNNAFRIFVRTLFTKDFRGAQKRLNSALISEMLDAYRKNQHDFQQFYMALQQHSEYYEKKPLREMRKEIVQFTVILNESGTDSLQILMRFTGIWPFC